MPSLIQGALAAEILGNTATAVPFLFHPKHYLAIGTTTTLGLRLSENTASSETLLQCFAIMILASNVPLAMAIPNSPRSKELRKAAFWQLGLTELFFVPLVLLKAADPAAAGITRDISTSLLYSVGVMLLWRAFALFVKPDLLGSESDIPLKKD